MSASWLRCVVLVVAALTAACGNVNSYQCTAANYVTPNANKTYFWADGAIPMLGLERLK